MPLMRSASTWSTSAAEWLPRLETILNDGYVVVVVGAMHFPGPTGLIVLLRQDGYTVNPAGWPAASVDGL
jgi:hypothetical protein